LARPKDLIQKNLDQELNSQEEEALKEICQEKPEIVKELEELRGAISFLTSLEKVAPPADFVAQVMQGLPDKVESTWVERLSRLFFTPHWIRWNLATALACGLVAIISLTIFWPLLNPPGQPEKGEKKIYLVKFVLPAPQAEKVFLAGDFNNWEKDALALTDREGNGLWTITLPLNPGTYNYMFIVNGKEWISDPYAEYYCDDGFGHRNAVLRISDS